MTTLQWKESPSAPPPASSANSTWFAVSMGLLGFIVGVSSLSMFAPGSSAQQTGQVIAPAADNPAIAAAPAAGGCGCGGGKGCGMMK